MKKIVRNLVVFGLITVFSVVSALSAAATEYVENVISEDFTAACDFLAPGDMDANGVINSTDSVSLRKLLLNNRVDKTYDELYASTGEQAMYSDVNGDSFVDIRDLVRQKKNLATNLEFIENGAMQLNGNSSYNGEFISVLGSGAEYEISYTYKSESKLLIKINGLSEQIIYENDPSADSVTVTKTFKTPLTITGTDGIEFQIIGVGTIEDISVTRINMDNELVNKW